MFAEKLKVFQPEARAAMYIDRLSDVNNGSQWAMLINLVIQLKKFIVYGEKLLKVSFLIIVYVI